MLLDHFALEIGPKRTPVFTKKPAVAPLIVAGRELKLPDKLIFGYENAKLEGSGIYHTSLPAGWTCPGALKCWAKADWDTGLITDHPRQEFRCFAASEEAVYTNVRIARLMNMGMLKVAEAHGGADTMAGLIQSSLPPRARIVRIHIGGDFFSQAHFDAWLKTAAENPKMRFYAYTKSLLFWVARLGIVPDNISLTASFGGRHDELIERHGLKSAKVVFHPEEAKALGLEEDHDDSHAHTGDKSFALVLHGTQQQGTPAASALTRMKRENVQFAYGRNDTDR